jgi:predicted RNase H-like HicB family nuclease
MKYPIAIEPGDADHAYGVAVPDLPACFSAGDTLDEGIDNAKEAVELWLETVLDDGAPFQSLAQSRNIKPIQTIKAGSGL